MTSGSPADRFHDIRNDPDPVRRARRLTEALTRLKQEEIELGRLRRVAIEEAASSGLSYSEVARQVGVSRGRVSQIRADSAAAERAFFGIGPIGLAYPLRRIPGRTLPMVAEEDVRARDELQAMLTSFSFAVELDGIDPEQDWEPSQVDLVAICGPKSSPTIARVLTADPVLNFDLDDTGRWGIEERATGHRHLSAMDDAEPEASDIAYLGRIPFDERRSLLLIAGVHAMGSVGVIDYLVNHLADLYRQVGTSQFSMVIRSTYQPDGTITTSEPACPPLLH